MRIDPGVSYDGFAQVTQGVNGGLPSHMLPRTQFSKAVNVTFRGMQPKTRPGWRRQDLFFLAEDNVYDGTLQTNFEDYIFQGASAFEARNELVVAVGGRLFRIRLDYWDVADITTPDTNNAGNYRDWFCEAEGFMIVQDGVSAPWIYDGATTRRSDTFGTSGLKEVPVGTAMSYSQGRLLVTLAGNQRSYVIGDIVGGPSGTLAYDFKDAVLKFTENDLINGGGSFTVPVNAGEIRAIQPVAQVDTSTGQGPTQIFTTSAVFSVNTPSERAAWATVNDPIQTYSVINNGALSDRACSLVNGDIWMRSLDGVRSFVVARRDFGTWVNAPVSEEVREALKTDAQDLLLYASIATFDNRLLASVRPYVNFEHGVVHEGMVVIDFSPVSYLGAQPRPVWEGVWTGPRLLQLVSGIFQGVERCFAFALDFNNNIILYELTKAQVNDFDGTDVQEIQCSLESGSYGFPTKADPEGGFDLKRLLKGWLWVTDLNGSVEIGTFYRANEDPCWHSWSSWAICGTTSTCSSSDCMTPQTLHPQYRRPYLLKEPTGACDSVVGVPDNVGEEFQLRVEWRGHCAFTKFLASAFNEEQDVTAICPQSESCQTVACCPPYDYTYVLN